MNAFGIPEILRLSPICSLTISRSVDRLAPRCEDARRSRSMFARFVLHLPITIVRFLSASLREIKRSLKCIFQDDMQLPSEVIKQQASRFIGWVRLCFVSSANPLPSYGFSAISQVSM